MVPRHRNINQYSTGQYLHGIFVLRKSFDTVLRMGLSYELLQSNIPTNMLDIIVLANCIPRTSAVPYVKETVRHILSKDLLEEMFRSGSPFLYFL